MWSTRSSAVSSSPAHEGDTAWVTVGGHGPAPATGLGTGIAYLLNYRLIADEGATAASTVTYLLPIVAVLLGILALGEPLTWNVVVGTALILAGVALAEGRIGQRVAGELRPTAEAPSPSSIPDQRR